MLLYGCRIETKIADYFEESKVSFETSQKDKVSIETRIIKI